MKVEIDKLLAPIAQKMLNKSNDILDLREAVLVFQDPGLCLSCYFKLLENSKGSSIRATTPLKKWLESHLEVVAVDDKLNELERVPVQLETADFEQYCRGLISTFRNDRGYQHISNIELSVQFKNGHHSAA